MRALVHIGPYKTGSSSIQMALRKNTGKLAEQAVLVPQIDVDTLAAPFLSDRMATEMQWRWPQGIDSAAAFRAFGEAAWASLAREVSAGGASLCILSSEHFSSPGGVDLERFFKTLRAMFSDVTLLCYVRAPVDHYVSFLQQVVRGGSRLARIEPAGYPFGVARALRNYLEYLPADQMIVRNFARETLVGQDVVQDFVAILARLGIATDLQSESANESLPGVAVGWLLSVNEAFDPAKMADQRRDLVRELLKSKALRELPKLKLTVPKLCAYIMHRAREDCDWINRTFLTGQVPLSLAADAGTESLTSDEEARALVLDWLAGYLTPESLKVLMAEFERCSRQASRPFPAANRKAGRAARAG